MVDKEEPELFDALQLEDTTKWEQAMNDEISWMSRLQNCVAHSSTKVEYLTIDEAEKEMILMIDYLEELDKK